MNIKDGCLQMGSFLQLVGMLAASQAYLVGQESWRPSPLTWLAQLELDNATCPNPVRIRW